MGVATVDSIVLVGRFVDFTATDVDCIEIVGVAVGSTDLVAVGCTDLVAVGCTDLVAVDCIAVEDLATV